MVEEDVVQGGRWLMGGKQGPGGNGWRVSE